jgi:hypothetical protein
LLVGVGGSDGGGVALGAELGLRIAPVTARWAYRALFFDRGYVTYSSGRLGWIFAERSWAAVHVGAGAGKLTYEYNVAPGTGSASVAAFSGEIGVHFAPRWGAGPLAAITLEALVPMPRAPDPRDHLLSAPAVAVTFSANPLGLLLWRLCPHVPWCL